MEAETAAAAAAAGAAAGQAAAGQTRSGQPPAGQAPAPEAQSVAVDPALLAGVQVAAGYQDCDAARAAGAAPVRQGDPGYRTELDPDGDGVACDT